MRSLTLRKIGITAIVLIFAVAALVLAYAYLPWDRHLPIGSLATGLIVIAVAEYMPVHIGSTRFRFRMAAQLPLAILIGLFPVLVLQLVVIAVRQSLSYIRSHSFTMHLPRFTSALALPFLAMIWFDTWHAHLSGHVPAPRLHTILIVLSTIFLYWLLALLLHVSPGARSATHPWQPVKGWLIALLAVDGLMTTSAIAQSTIGHALVQVMICLQLVALMLAVGVYADASMQRARLVQLPALLEVLTEDTSPDKLAEHLFDGVAALLAVDVMELWRRDNGRQFVLGQRVDYATDKGTESAANWVKRPPQVQPGEGLVGFCASSREVVTVLSSQQPVIFVWNIDRSKFQSAMAVPIFDGNEVQAVLVVYHRHVPMAYRKRDVELMQVLGSQFSHLYYSLRRLEVTRIQSQTDELTGLYNYRHFDLALHECVRQSDELGLPVSLLILDIDHFKKINDSHGHLAGNEVLQQLADVFRDMLRQDDIIARYGGEEFTILLPGEDQHAASMIAERIRQRVEAMAFTVQSHLAPTETAATGTTASNAAPSVEGAHLIQLTVSIGVATYPTNAESALTLIRHADRAMYIGSKQSGRNRVTVYLGDD